MHTLIVCGTPWCDLDSVFSQLQSAGVAAALPATNGSIGTLQNWHQRLFAHNPQPHMPVAPGKAWEQAAGELFLANWEQPLWGWADARSTWLLDFWLQFDPQTRFVLVHTPAADALLAAAQNPHTTNFDAAQVLDAWCAHQAHMLQFYHRHRDRCAWWPDLQPDRSTPALSNATLALEWPVQLNLALAIQRPHTPSDPALELLHNLATQAVQQHEAATALQNEIWATIPGLVTPPAGQTRLPSSKGQAAALLSQVRQVTVVQMGQLRHDLQRHTQTAQELVAQIQLSQAQAEHHATVAQAEAHARAETQHQLAAAHDSLNTLRSQLAQETQAKEELQQESELLLLQLHQVQEELERTFLHASELQQQVQNGAQQAELQARCDQLQHQLQAEAQARSQAEQHRDALLHNQAALEQQLQEAQHHIGALHAQQQAEATALAQTQQQRDALAQQLQALHTQQQSDATTLAEAQQQRDALAQQHAEAVQESELLLMQLHQVQEELEHYFLQHQQAQQTNQQLQDRITRWAQRYPDHVEWASLAVLPHTQAQQQDLLISELQQGGREFGQLHLQLRRTKKHKHLVLLHQAGHTPPLLRWPQADDATADTPSPAAEVVLDFNAPAGTPAAALLNQLAPSDIQLLKAVCKAVAGALPHNVPDRDTWAQHWQDAADAFTQLPTTWRFDQLSLRHEQVNPDYEHLWLRLTRAQFGEQHWPVYEFRLSANNIRKGKWSHLPKLEFPLPDNNLPKQFENWFEEAEDDKGPKFELRFDMKTPAMDINCWNTLSPQDQTQALALVSQLHTWLDQLAHTGTAIHRPWDDWHQMASGIQHALVRCLHLNPELVGQEGPALS